MEKKKKTYTSIYTVLFDMEVFPKYNHKDKVHSLSFYFAFERRENKIILYLAELVISDEFIIFNAHLPVI